MGHREMNIQPFVYRRREFGRHRKKCSANGKVFSKWSVSINFATPVGKRQNCLTDVKQFCFAIIAWKTKQSGKNVKVEFGKTYRAKTKQS